MVPIRYPPVADFLTGQHALTHLRVDFTEKEPKKFDACETRTEEAVRQKQIPVIVGTVTGVVHLSFEVLCSKFCRSRVGSCRYVADVSTMLRPLDSQC